MDSRPEDDLNALLAQMRKVLEGRWESSLQAAKEHADRKGIPLDPFLEGFRMGYWNGARDVSSVDVPALPESKDPN